jgi:L-ascorbate metabolism protein UlaG (beta-lactamase superfamily)
MKKHKVLKTLLIIAAILLIIGGIGAFAFYKYFTVPIGKYPDKARAAEFVKLSGQYSDGQFHNENEVGAISGAVSLDGLKKPEKLIPAEKIDGHLEAASKDVMNISWLGHSSALVQIGGDNVLIDPILTTSGKPLQLYSLPARISEVPLDIDDMSAIDVLCISHDHFDHLDYGTITAIDDRVSDYVVPLGVDSLLVGWGVNRDKIHTLSWWSSVELRGVTYTLTPAQHYSGRFAGKQYKTLWGGFYIAGGSHSLYFTGDSGYCGTFAEIYEKLGAPEIMLADSGQDTPAWSHMSPEEVTKAAKDVHAQYILPVHWAAYNYAGYDWYKPAEDIVKQAEADGVAVITPKPGHIFNFDDAAAQNEHWWEEYK